MVLYAYQQQTQRLLNDEAAQFFNIADLTAYINQARNQIAVQTESLIANAALSTTNATQSYTLAALTPPTGYQAPINIRSIRVTTGGNLTVIEARPWQWFQNYYLSGPASVATGVPTVWSQQIQGSTGSIWFSPTPNATIPCSVEASWTPTALSTDASPEVLAYPWTDAVPYFAACIAYLQAQRQQDAQNMWMMYQTFLNASLLGVTPNWMPLNFPSAKALQSPIDANLTLNGPAAKPAQMGEGRLGGG